MSGERLSLAQIALLVAPRPVWRVASPVQLAALRARGAAITSSLPPRCCRGPSGCRPATECCGSPIAWMSIWRGASRHSKLIIGVPSYNHEAKQIPMSRCMVRQ